MESDIELKITFRFICLSDSQADKLSEEFEESKFGKHFKTKMPVGLIPLKEENIQLISKFIATNNIATENTDIFISFITEYDTRIVEIPQYVARAATELKSKMTLSYTIN